MHATGDTIAAIATPPGRGAIAIVRCSGPEARAIVARVFRSVQPLVDRRAVYGTVLDVLGGELDRALGLAMDGPRSATGEDVVELHVHGSPSVAGETLRALLVAGARLAAPGEFTRRGFLNGKLDLTAAEAVADVVAAESHAQARAAVSNLAGGLRRRIAAIGTPLHAMLEQLAGALDFPDEIAAPTAVELRGHVAAALTELDALMGSWERGRHVREGLSLAIVGPPNAGKSSLLNALLGEERAIVSAMPGTTRDTLDERFAIDGVFVRAIDTAGIRATDDEIEKLGIARARTAARGAALRLVVIDGSAELGPDARAVLEETRDSARVVFFNKADRGDVGYRARGIGESEAIHGSVRESETLDALRAAIARMGWGGASAPDAARPHLASARQADGVARAHAALADAAATLAAGEPIDLIARDLLDAVAALDEVTGETANAATLDQVFARFCVGK